MIKAAARPMESSSFLMSKKRDILMKRAARFFTSTHPLTRREGEGRPLVVSRRWVPRGAGTSLLLYELFRHFPDDSVRVVCGPGLRPHTELTHPFETHRLTLKPADRGLTFLTNKAAEVCIPIIREYLRHCVRMERPRTIFAHYPDAAFLIPAADVAAEFDIPLVIYFDAVWKGNTDGRLSPAHESRIVRQAQRRFSLTEAFCQDLEDQHGVPWEPLPHVFLLPEEMERPTEKARHQRVHFAGGVYPLMNTDSMTRLHDALKTLDDPPTFQVLGNNPPDVLSKAGLTGPLIETGLVPREEMFGIQRSSEILYLPAAFHSDWPDFLKSNFPTKALEYMVAGRPILVHGPKGFYLTELAREHEFALVVDEPDVIALAKAVERLRTDKALVERITHHALEFAKSRDGIKWSQMLQRALGLP